MSGSLEERGGAGRPVVPGAQAEPAEGSGWARGGARLVGKGDAAWCSLQSRPPERCASGQGTCTGALRIHCGSSIKAGAGATTGLRSRRRGCLGPAGSRLPGEVRLPELLAAALTQLVAGGEQSPAAPPAELGIAPWHMSSCQCCFVPGQGPWGAWGRL